MGRRPHAPPGNVCAGRTGERHVQLRTASVVVVIYFNVGDDTNDLRRALVQPADDDRLSDGALPSKILFREDIIDDCGQVSIAIVAGVEGPAGQHWGLQH